MNGFFRTRRAQRCAGIVLVEVIFVIVILAMLSAIWSGSFHRAREKTHLTVDLANLRQILKGSAIYNGDNNDHMAHPTWGGDLTGPDGWAYLTRNDGRVPGALQTPGSCAGRDVNTAQFTNQLAFFKKGQVTQYLDDVKTAWCPKDVATRNQGTGASSLRARWLQRPVKVTSYCWNGTIGGHVGPLGPALGYGETYKVSQFRPEGWQMWEQNESDAFNFTDAASNPANSNVGTSARHSGLPRWWTVISSRRNLPGGAVVGKFDGSAHVIKWPQVYDLVTQRVRPPNDLLNGPTYEKN